MWKTVFPAEHKGYGQVNNLSTAADLVIVARDNYETNRVIARTLVGTNEFKVWRLTSERVVKRFESFLRNNAFSGRLKVRLRIQTEREATLQLA